MSPAITKTRKIWHIAINVWAQQYGCHSHIYQPREIESNHLAGGVPLLLDMFV